MILTNKIVRIVVLLFTSLHITRPQTALLSISLPVSLHSAMFGMDPGAVPEPAEYSSPPSPRSNTRMEEEEVIDVAALIVITQSEK